MRVHADAWPRPAGGLALPPSERRAGSLVQHAARYVHHVAATEVAAMSSASIPGAARGCPAPQDQHRAGHGDSPGQEPAAGGRRAGQGLQAHRQRGAAGRGLHHRPCRAVRRCGRADACMRPLWRLHLAFNQCTPHHTSSNSQAVQTSFCVLRVPHRFTHGEGRPELSG